MKISINSNYNSQKSKEYNNSKVSHGWHLVRVSWDEDDLIRLTTSEAVSGNEWIDGHKVKASWVQTHALMLYFDDSYWEFQDLRDKQIAMDISSYLFPSQNHLKRKKDEPACHRLRLLIPLASPITNGQDLEILKEFFSNEFDGHLDTTCFDNHRYFAHGLDTDTHFIDADYFDWTYVVKRYSNKNRPAQPVWTFKLDDQIELADGTYRTIRDIGSKQSILCPVCGRDEGRGSPGQHNAMITFHSETGLPQIFCSSCKARGMGQNGNYYLDREDSFFLKSKETGSFVFIDSLTCKIFGGAFRKATGQYEFRELSSIWYMKAFCKSNDLPVPDPLPQYDYVLDFSSNTLINHERELINRYVPTDLILMEPESKKSYCIENTPMIYNLVNHVIAGDDNIFDLFIHNLAYLIQRRRKWITAFLFQGTQGTGKGVLFREILTPIIGHKYCAEVSLDAFDTHFNSFLQNNLLVLINEMSGNFLQESRKPTAVTEKIKIAITDTYIQIESKGRDPINGRNFSSFLGSTNKRNAMVIPKDDRRWNVASRQEEKLQDQPWYESYPVFIRQLRSELEQFTLYLKTYPIDEYRIGETIDNEAKRILQAWSIDFSEEFFELIKTRNGDLLREYIKNEDYEITSIIESIERNRWISTENLCNLYNHIGDRKINKRVFGRMCTAHGMTRIKRKSANGWKLNGTPKENVEGIPF